MYRYGLLASLMLASHADAASIIHFQDDYAALPGGELVFVAGSNTGSTYRINLGLGYDNYRMEFDLTTANLVGSSYTFGLNFDTPSVQNLDFHGNLGVHTFNTTSTGPSVSGNWGPFSDGTTMHVVIDADLTTNKWTIDTGSILATTSFFADLNDVLSIRMGLGPWIGSTGDPTVQAFVDNVVVSSTVVPLPAAFWLFVSGLLGLVSYTRIRS